VRHTVSRRVPVKRDKRWDVVVVGSGVGGLCTALTASEMGLQPLVIEKADTLGGSTAVSYGGLWIGNNHIAKAAGYKDNREDVIKYMRFVGGSELNEARFLAFVDESPAALRFFESCGVGFMITKALVDHYYDSVPGSTAEGRSLEPTLISADELGKKWRDSVFLPPNAPCELSVGEVIQWGGITNLSGWNTKLLRERRRERIRGRGVALVTHLLKQLLRRNVTIERGIAAERLLVNSDNSVGGVKLSHGRAALGNAVVLATGGYESNPTLVKAFEGLPGWQSMFPQSITGDGLVMATEVGAGMKLIHNNMALFLGFRIPGKASSPPFFRIVGISEMLCPHTIVVNRSGSRFADEAYFQGMVPKLREFVPASHEYANLPCFLIFDRSYERAFSFAGRPVGAPIPRWVARDNSIARLAQRLGIDPNGLERTVRRFNRFARSGIDEDFNRGRLKWSLARRESWNRDANDGGYRNPSLGRLQTPPFYGVELHPSAFASGGLVTDELGRVISVRGHPITGLYSVGNAAAHSEYGVGYQAGSSLASGMTFGYLAGKHIAEILKSRSAALRHKRRQTSPQSE
jgi:3-oxosteroid 1-dehydrogenase